MSFGHYWNKTHFIPVFSFLTCSVVFPVWYEILTITTANQTFHFVSWHFCHDQPSDYEDKWTIVTYFSL